MVWKQDIDLSVHWFTAMGLFEHYIQQETLGGGATTSWQAIIESRVEEPLTVEHLFVGLCLLVVGLFVSFLFLLGEVTRKKLQTTNLCMSADPPDLHIKV